MDQIMHAADLFETFKVYATIKVVELTLKPGTTDKKGVEDLIKISEAYGDRVVAAFIPGRPDGAFVDKSVKAISDGKKWCVLDPVLKYYKFTDRIPEPVYETSINS
jgi:hypothetical protein